MSIYISLKVLNLLTDPCKLELLLSYDISIGNIVEGCATLISAWELYFLNIGFGSWIVFIVLSSNRQRGNNPILQNVTGPTWWVKFLINWNDFVSQTFEVPSIDVDNNIVPSIEVEREVTGLVCPIKTCSPILIDEFNKLTAYILPSLIILRIKLYTVILF